MRISRIHISNYRQFVDFDLNLRKVGSSDVHLFVGSNGTGKTNLLNALNWCLYNDEPHLTDESRSLPMLNLNIDSRLKPGGNTNVSVEIRCEIGQGDQTSSFLREARLNIHEGKLHTSLESSRFRVSFQDRNQNTKFAEGDDAKLHVDRLVPVGIREYFFFDGERLDSYFKEEAGQRIGKAVFEIAQIDKLAAVERKLSDLLKELEKDAAKISPEIKVIKEERDKAETNADELQARLEECDKQMHRAEKEATEYSEKLRNLPNVESLELERSEIDKGIISWGEMLKHKETERSQLLFHYGILINLYGTLVGAVKVIEDKRTRGEIPPAVNRQLLESTLAQSKCCVCGKQLDRESEHFAQALLHEIELSSEIANELMRIETPLRVLLYGAPNFKRESSDISREIATFKDQIDKYRKRKEEIDKELDGFNAESVRDWATSRREFEELAKQLREDKVNLGSQVQSAKKQLVDLEHKLRVELYAEKKLNELQKQIGFCSEARAVSRLAVNRITNEVREEIEGRANEIFKELIWKKSTYDRIAIDPSYNIVLYHTAGYNALGSASAAERELLALAFTLALHEVSGFDAPLVIDTPVARVSDMHREKFAEVLAKVGESGKQMLLLFTPDEYTLSVSRYLEQVAASKWKFHLDSSEREATLEDFSG